MRLRVPWNGISEPIEETHDPPQRQDEGRLFLKTVYGSRQNILDEIRHRRTGVECFSEKLIHNLIFEALTVPFGAISSPGSRAEFREVLKCVQRTLVRSTVGWDEFVKPFASKLGLSADATWWQLRHMLRYTDEFAKEFELAYQWMVYRRGAGENSETWDAILGLHTHGPNHDLTHLSYQSRCRTGYPPTVNVYEAYIP